MRKFGVFAVLLVLLSCKNETSKVTVLQGDAFGTTYTIQYVGGDLAGIEKGVDSVIHTINRSMSTYMPNSDISKINKGASDLVVDTDFKAVFRLSEEVHKRSGGYFDPTVGVLRNAYGFGDENPLQKIDSTTLDSLLQYVGFDKVRLTSEGTVEKSHPEIYFDFNAIAKGYGIDRIGAFLTAEGVDAYLIELGGEILAKGTNPAKGQPWVVGIETVDSQLDDRTFQITIQLQDKAMASSGNYRKFRVDSVSGKKYVHTINPLTGSTEQSDVTSATVVAETCAEADAYATAFMALGLKRSKALLEKSPQLEAYLTYSDTLDAPQVFMTEGFKRLLNK
ncbi:FAD:protein FMN transferase [Altibacter sp.]|uniref:FAD:protein FMN transferase n=1 Tax=Altibacter sp. TaxID=2024823 RepID=UPI000C8E3951|nr:FAD:protein FMN transferase [Altibacter sp.]MAP54293.1 thiamine biosynthesis protein ApbE [Altibacter sp.]